MLLILYDGEVHSSYQEAITGLTETDYDRDLDAAILNIKDAGVSIYTVAIGQWLDEQPELDRVRDMATGSSYFSCSDTWQSALSTALEGLLIIVWFI